MSNPVQAFPNTICDGCGNEVPEGDDLFLNDGEKLCRGCAEDSNLCCPECGDYKREEHKTCYECRNQ